MGAGTTIAEDGQSIFHLIAGAHIAALVRWGDIDKSVQFCTDGTNIASVAFFSVRILGAWLSQTPPNLPGAFFPKPTHCSPGAGVECGAGAHPDKSYGGPTGVTPMHMIIVPLFLSLLGTPQPIQRVDDVGREINRMLNPDRDRDRDRDYRRGREDQRDRDQERSERREYRDHDDR
jgi:hypothetical protein